MNTIINVATDEPGHCEEIARQSIVSEQTSTERDQQ